MADISHLLGDDDIRTVLQNSGKLGEILDFVLSVISKEQSGRQVKLARSPPRSVPSAVHILHDTSVTHFLLCLFHCIVTLVFPQFVLFIISKGAVRWAG